MQDPTIESAGGVEDPEATQHGRLQKAALVTEEKFVWGLNEIRYFLPASEGWRRLTFNDGKDAKQEMSFEAWEALMYRICVVWAIGPKLPLVSEVISRLMAIAVAELERFARLQNYAADGACYTRAIMQLFCPGVLRIRMYSGLAAEDLFLIIGDQARTEYHARLTAIGLELPPFTPTT